MVKAAIDIADANPSGGVSMRAVAEPLGVTSMALYWYVSGKDALVALAYDAIHGEMPDHSEDSDPWREGVLAWAQDLADLYLRHPWALRVTYARPVLGPNEQQVLESLTKVIRATELGPSLLRRVVGMLFHTVRGAALTIAEGKGRREAWYLREGLVAIIFRCALRTGSRFADGSPNTTWLLSDSGDGTTTGEGGYVEQQAMANLRVGVDVLLDVLESAMPVTTHRG